MAPIDSMESTERKTSAIPLTCAEGHQIYVVYFPAINRYGFACGFCHELGTTITKGTKVLMVRPAHEVMAASIKEDLLLYMETKAGHLTCEKKHPLMVFQLREGEGFAFGCIHCKRYSLELLDRDKLLSVTVFRELAKPENKIIIQ